MFFFTEVVYLQHRLVATWTAPHVQYPTYVASDKMTLPASAWLCGFGSQNVRQDSSSFTWHSVHLSLRKKCDFDAPFALQVEAFFFFFFVY